MLNIGKLGPGAAEYYIGEVATAAEDYYTGRGEAKGRWVGSLRETLGLSGEVDPEDLRRVLNGEHPQSGERLVSAQGSAGRAAARRSEPVPRDHRGGRRLGPCGSLPRTCPTSTYGRLLKAGADYESALDNAGADDVVQEPRRYLKGELVPAAGKTGGDAWRIRAAGGRASRCGADSGQASAGV